MPCPKLLNCVKDCEDYVLDTANKTHINNLVQLQIRTQLTLGQAVQQQAKHEEDLSENWIAEAEATLTGVQRILDAAAVKSSDGIVRPFVGKGSKSRARERPMPRPSLEHEVRQAVREYLHMAETLSSEEAPLNALAVAERLNFNRKTLKKYGLDADIASAAERQSRNGELSPKIKARRSMNNMLRDRSQEIEALRHRCEALVATVCLVEGNAQRLGIDPAELWRPLAVPERSLPHTGGRRFPRV
jgi:hypothetical protein